MKRTVFGSTSVRKGDGGDAAEESPDIKGGIRATGPAELAPSSKF